MKLTVVIPSWNGGALLARHLPEVVKQAHALEGGAEVLVVDDGSDLRGAATEEAVRAAGAPARLLRRTEHRGFGITCNAGATAARGELLLFLNNDMCPDEGCLATLVTVLDLRSDAFAVAPVIVNCAEGFVESTSRMRIRRGVFDAVFPGRVGAPPPCGDVRPIAFACGGALACRRKMFLELGGFSEEFTPFYWEDADLCWRARRCGLSVFEVGNACVRHDHAQTIGTRFTHAAIRRAYECNRLVFTWTHLSGAGAWLCHLGWLPLRFVAALARGDEVAALPRALGRAGAVVRTRRRLRGSAPAARALVAEVRASRERGWP